MSVNLFLFCMLTPLYYFLDSTFKWYHICLGLISLNIIISRSIHVAANGIVSFFLCLSNIPLCVCVCVCVYIYLLLFSCSLVSDSLWPHGLQHARLPCPSPSFGVCSNSCPSNQWCLPTSSSSVTPFSSCPQSFPTLDCFPPKMYICFWQLPGVISNPGHLELYSWLKVQVACSIYLDQKMYCEGHYTFSGKSHHTPANQC